MTAAWLLLAGALLRVTETAGIRRFNYPVTVRIPGKTGLRLLENGRPVPAQYREGELDFNVSLGPREQRIYVLEEAPGGSSPPAVVREENHRLTVSFTPSLEFAVPRDLLGLLESVRTPRWDYLRPGSQGLLLRRDAAVYRAGGRNLYGSPARARIVKQGPLAAALEFASAESVGGSRTVQSVVRLDFPRSKSWVKTSWTLEDPEGYVSALGLDLNLNVSPERTLFDFGAGSLVYGQLPSGQPARLFAGPLSWRVSLGPEPYVTGEGRVEGWAHVMDSERAIAVAVEDLARREGSIEITEGRHLVIWKETPGSGFKTLVFWLHFVGMPVQVGAATSPQSMLAPLQVELQ